MRCAFVPLDTPLLLRMFHAPSRARVSALAAALTTIATLAFVPSATASSPVLHERIPPDPREDVALSVSLDGDLPAALDTPSGLVTAPDPRRPPTHGEPSPSTPSLADAPPNATFKPDRDTRRPDTLPYEDPFTPSTAPFKRLMAFDSVDASYTLSVRDTRLALLSTHAAPATDGSDEQFYGDLVVDLAPGKRTRVPSVGPGAKIMRARAGIGTADVPFRMLRDGAENWYVEADSTTRARLVMELSIPRAAFGGEIGDPAWSDLPKASPLPGNVLRAANEVAMHIGVSRGESPRDVVTKLVTYFRGFVDSDDMLPSNGDVYLDLALSKKGVCRHRAFAFLVTALGLGIPTRMVTNEAHAWVEVHDGSLWRRIDLGGAGRALREPLALGVRHEPQSDPFSWPPNATRGEDLADRARTLPASSTGGNASASGPSSASSSASSRTTNGVNVPPVTGSNDESNSASTTPAGSAATKDERPPATVELASIDGDAHRGAPLRVHGTVRADGDPCAYVLVDLVLRDARGKLVPIGALATDPHGAFEGAIVVPGQVPLGDYDVVARTTGDARCGRGVSR